MNPDPQLWDLVRREQEELRSRPPDIPFSRAEYAERLARLRRDMEENGLDLLLVTSPEAIAWLHGFRPRWNKAHSPMEWPPLQATAVHAHHDRFIVFETEEHEDLLRLTSVSGDNRLSAAEDLGGMLPFVVGELAAEGWLGGTVGVEKWSPVPNRAVGEKVEAALAGRGAEVFDASRLVREVRRIKSPAELESVERAARACDAGLLALRDALRPGITELEAWAELVRAMVAAGGEPAALHEAVKVGPYNLGHAISSRREVRAGDAVSADPCGVVHGYHANAAASIFVGEPPPEAVRLNAIQAGAFDVLRSAARPGATTREVCRALRDYYSDAGVRGLPGWCGGYELGLSVPPDWVGDFLFEVEREGPDLTFQPNMVTNYESNLHYIMIDTIVYGEAGARPLSAVSRELLVSEG